MAAKGHYEKNGSPQALRSAVVDAAIEFVLKEWAEAVSVKGSESASYPAEFINLHDAVCRLKGWEPQGDFPDAQARRG